MLCLLQTLAIFVFRFYQTAIKLEKEWGLSDDPTPGYLFKLHLNDQLTRLKKKGHGNAGYEVKLKGSRHQDIPSGSDERQSPATVPLLDHEINMDGEEDEDDDFTDEDWDQDSVDASCMSEFGSQTEQSESSLGTKIVRRASQHAPLSQSEMQRGKQPPVQQLGHKGQAYPAVQSPYGAQEASVPYNTSRDDIVQQAKKIQQHGKEIVSGVKKLATGKTLVKGVDMLEKKLNKAANKLHVPGQPDANLQQTLAKKMEKFENKVDKVAQKLHMPSQVRLKHQQGQRSDHTPPYPVQPQPRIQPPDHPSQPPPRPAYPPGLSKRVSSLGPMEETNMFRMFSGASMGETQGGDEGDGGAAEAEEIMDALKGGIGGLLGKKKKEKDEEKDKKEEGKDKKDKDKKNKDKDKKDQKGKDTKEKKAEKEKDKKGKDKDKSTKGKKETKKDEKGKKDKKEKTGKNHSKVQKKSEKGSKPAKAKKAKKPAKKPQKAKPKKAKKPKMGKKRR